MQTEHSNKMARMAQAKAGKTATAPELIAQRNAGREPDRLARKYKIMRSGPFGFLRGTPDLFFRRLIEHDLAPEGPPAWCTGDQHIENFGTYLGSNGLAYFDLNDFDAACLAPAPWDVLRLVTSLLIAGPTLDIRRPQVVELARAAVDTWSETLATGRAGWVERRTADGIIGQLLTSLRKRDPVTLLDRRTTVGEDGVRSLQNDGKRMLPVTKKEKLALRKWLHETMAEGNRERGFFTLIDAARRIAGVDSLGASRYALLIEGTGSPNGNVLLDLKSAEPSAAQPFSPCKQPDWASEAERIVEVQKRCEAMPPDFLRAVSFAGEPIVLKLLQPQQDRLDLVAAAKHPETFGDAVHTMAQLSAWAHLRSSGRQGSATADELIRFGRQKGFGKQLLEIVGKLEELVLADYTAFTAAYDAGTMAGAPAEAVVAHA